MKKVNSVSLLSLINQHTFMLKAIPRNSLQKTGIHLAWWHVYTKPQLDLPLWHPGRLLTTLEMVNSCSTGGDQDWPQRDTWGLLRLIIHKSSLACSFGIHYFAIREQGNSIPGHISALRSITHHCLSLLADFSETWWWFPVSFLNTSFNVRGR